jgi:hypothetical protein
MGPLDLFWGIAPLLLAGVVWMLMQLVKTAIDMRIGREKRKEKLWLTRIVLPALSPVLGFVLAMFIPLRPESLVDFVSRADLSEWQSRAVYGALGAAVGQFADYLYSKLKSLIQDARPQP